MGGKITTSSTQVPSVVQILNARHLAAFHKIQNNFCNNFLQK